MTMTPPDERPAVPADEQTVDPFAGIQRFYRQALGCRPCEGASSDQCPMTLHGHLLVLERELDPERGRQAVRLRLPAEGLVLGVDEWCDVEQRLREHGLAPSISVPRPIGTNPGQQCVMDIEDPLGNVISLRGFSESQATLAA